MLIILKKEGTGAYRVNVFSLQGQKVLEKDLNNTGSGNRYTVVLPNIAPGMYILELRNQKSKAVTIKRLHNSGLFFCSAG